MIVLTAKPHQEHINNIKHFIWRICVSYRGLNKVTKLFEYPIPRCDDEIHIFRLVLVKFGLFMWTPDKGIINFVRVHLTEKSWHIFCRTIKILF